LIKPGGSKLWRFRDRFGGIEKMLSLGAYPAVSLANGRFDRDIRDGQFLVATQRTDKLDRSNDVGGTAARPASSLRPAWGQAKNCDIEYQQGRRRDCWQENNHVRYCISASGSRKGHARHRTK
jgi:hypothetical protein